MKEMKGKCGKSVNLASQKYETRERLPCILIELILGFSRKLPLFIIILRFTKKLGLNELCIFHTRPTPSLPPKHCQQ